MRELVDKRLMLEDVKSWVAMDSYEQHLINNMSEWIENLPTVEVSDGDCISRRMAIDAIEKCYTCKHVYQRVSDADTLYCRCRKGCRYEEFKPKRSTGNPQWHEGEN